MQQYDTAATRCEATASEHGHALSTWYPVGERLHAALCEECGDIGWVSRSGDEEGWRVGGRALSRGCPGEQLSASLGPNAKSRSRFSFGELLLAPINWLDTRPDH